MANQAGNSKNLFTIFEMMYVQYFQYEVGGNDGSFLSNRHQSRSICDELGDIPSYQRECMLLKAMAKGGSVAGFSRSLGLTREHVARTIQQRALKLLSRDFLARVRDIE